MRTKLFNALKVSALALLLSFGLSFVYAWTAPTANPPAGNVSAPINTSATAQTKAGNLTVSATTTSSYFADLVNPTFFVQPSGESKFWNTTIAGTTTTSGLKVLNGAGANKVLTSDASGNASWATSTSATPAGSCAVGQSITAINSNGTVVCGVIIPPYGAVGDLARFNSVGGNGNANPYVAGITYSIDTIWTNMGGNPSLAWHHTYESQLVGTYWRASIPLSYFSGGSNGQSSSSWIFIRVS